MPKHTRSTFKDIRLQHIHSRASSQRLFMTEDKVLIDYLFHLRFDSSGTGDALRPILNFASISKIMWMPLSTVIRLIKIGLESMLKKLPI